MYLSKFRNIEDVFQTRRDLHSEKHVHAVEGEMVGLELKGPL